VMATGRGATRPHNRERRSPGRADPTGIASDATGHEL
jgi:hypothetical protein